MKSDILDCLDALLKTLQECKTQEKDGKTINLYNFHIERTHKIIETLKKEGLDKKMIREFFEDEGRSYGWSYLPNNNGRIAEEAFWNLKKRML